MRALRVHPEKRRTRSTPWPDTPLISSAHWVSRRSTCLGSRSAVMLRSPSHFNRRASCDASCSSVRVHAAASPPRTRWFRSTQRRPTRSRAKLRWTPSCTCFSRRPSAAKRQEEHFGPDGTFGRTTSTCPARRRPWPAQLAAAKDWRQIKGERFAELKRIAHPTLVVNGSNDIMVPTINSFTLSQRMPNAQLILYPDSGHGSQFQYPELFVSHARNFLDT